MRKDVFKREGIADEVDMARCDGSVILVSAGVRDGKRFSKGC